MARAQLPTLLGDPCASERSRAACRSNAEDDALIEEGIHLPPREAARWRHLPLDQDDLVGDGFLGLVKAARRFDPTYKVPFAAFATPFVRGAIGDTVRAGAQRAHLGEGRFASVVGFQDVVRSSDDDLYEPPDPAPTPHETVEAIERLRMLATIPHRERVALVRTVIDGDSAVVVARDLGVTPGRVHMLVRNGATRLRKRAA